MERRARDTPTVDLEPLELRARPVTLTWWSLLGTILTAVGAYLVIDSGGHPLSWAAVGLFAVVATYFLSQLFAPSLVHVRLDRQGLHARAFGRRTELRWEWVQLARVRRIFGESVLLLDVYAPATNGWQHRMVGILLPLGCDLDALERFLDRRLGRNRQLQPPAKVRPLDLGGGSR